MSAQVRHPGTTITTTHCAQCGFLGRCFSVVFDDGAVDGPTCAECYTDGVAHGGCACCIKGAYEFVLEVFGQLPSLEVRLIRSALGDYYGLTRSEVEVAVTKKCADEQCPTMDF